MIEFRLTEEHRSMISTVRALAQKQFKPNAAKYMDGTFPWENVRELGKIGVMGMGIPEQYGGLNLPVLESALVLEEIAKVCYNTAMAVMSQLGVQSRVISRYAPEHLRQEILPPVARGEMMLAVAMTEPQGGTDVANYRTNTVIEGGRATIRGVKTLISKVDEAEWYVVFSRINGKPGREGIGCVLLNRNTPGFEVTGRFHTMGGEHLGELQFNCEVPVEQVILQEDGFKKLINAFNTQRCLNPSISLGLAEGAFEEAIKYARDRITPKGPISEFQAIQHKLAEMYRDIEVGRSILYRACGSADPFPVPHEAAVAKLYCNEMAIRVTSEAIQIHGGYGFTDEYPVSRLYRGARYGTLGGGTTETLKNLLARTLKERFQADGFLGMDTF